MPRVKQTSKKKRVTKAAVPALGAAGLTFSLVGGASAAAVPTADVQQTPNLAPTQALTLGEEEIADVSLATFYVFDKENTAQAQGGVQVAWARLRRLPRLRWLLRWLPSLPRLRRRLRLRRWLRLAALLGRLPPLLSGRRLPTRSTNAISIMAGFDKVDPANPCLLSVASAFGGRRLCIQRKQVRR